MKEKRKEGLINGEDLKRGQLEVHVISSQTFFPPSFFPLRPPPPPPLFWLIKFRSRKKGEREKETEALAGKIPNQDRADAHSERRGRRAN